MFQCHVCGCTNAQSKLTSEVFTVGNRRVLIEHIPAQVCDRCGEATFSRETTENIRQLVHGSQKPIKTVPLEVFDLA
jgi:HTH-type transcriptional regulator/antitoxin MqsA